MVDKKLMGAAAPYRGKMLVSISCAVLGAATILFQAWFLADIINQVFLHGAGLGDVKSSMLWALVAMTLRLVLTIIAEAWSLDAALAIQAHFKAEIVSKVHRLGPVYLAKEQSGVLLNFLGEGVGLLQGYFAQYLPQLVKAAAIPVLFLFFIFPIDWVSGLILLVTAPLVPFFMVLIGKWTNTVSQKQWLILSRLSGYLQDVLKGLETLKMLGQSKQQHDKIAEISNRYRQTTLQVLKWAFLSSLTLELFTTISIALVSVGLGLRLVEGMLGFREAFFVLLLAPEFYAPLRSLGGYFHASLDAVAAAEDIYGFLGSAEPAPLPKGTGVENVVGQTFAALYMAEVCFTFPGQDRPALDQVTLSLHKGEKIALVGPSGGGKTTVLNILLGFLTSQSGQVVYNGMPLTQGNIGWWQRQVAIVNQKPFIFPGTIRENILLGDGADAALFADIFQATAITSVFANLPMGLDTIVGDGGVSLSGGQRQIIALLRALCSDKEVVLIDEGTANLDLVTEAYITALTERLLQERSGVIVAHRLSTIAAVDRIYYLDQGRVLEQGSHGELLVADGFYQRLYEGGQSE